MNRLLLPLLTLFVLSLVGCQNKEANVRPLGTPEPATSTATSPEVKEWYAPYHDPRTDGSLEGKTFKYEASKGDDWRIDPYLLAAGAKETTTTPADIIVKDGTPSKDPHGMSDLVVVAQNKKVSLKRQYGDSYYDDAVRKMIRSISGKQFAQPIGFQSVPDSPDMLKGMTFRFTARPDDWRIDTLLTSQGATKVETGDIDILVKDTTTEDDPGEVIIIDQYGEYRIKKVALNKTLSYKDRVRDALCDLASHRKPIQ